MEPGEEYNMAGLENAHPALGIEQILVMHLFPKCSWRTQKSIVRTCSFWRSIYYFKPWIPNLVTRNQNNKRWWAAKDIAWFNGYGFHNNQVQDWADFLDGLRWLFKDEYVQYSKKRKREEATHPGMPQKRQKLE